MNAKEFAMLVAAVIVAFYVNDFLKTGSVTLPLIGKIGK